MMCGSGDLAQILCSFSRSLEKITKGRIRPSGSSLLAPSIPNRVPSKSRYRCKLGTAIDSEMNHPEESWSEDLMKLLLGYLDGRSKGLDAIFALVTRGRGH